MYPRIPCGNCRGSLGIRGAQFGEPLVYWPVTKTTQEKYEADKIIKTKANLNQ
jgi:hypothetical protein